MPERGRLLDEAVASVASQTVPPFEHLWLLDEHQEGPGQIRNRLAERAQGDYLLFLDDDDVLHTDYVQELTPHLDAEVVYSWCRVEGRDDWCPNRLFEPRALEHQNFIPVTACVQKQAFLDVGGFDTTLGTLEDWDLWKRLLRAGARFKCVPEVLWTYRVKAAGTSRNKW